MAITAATRLFALLGNPVDHSQSPRMQNAAFAAANVDGVFVALRCDTADVAPLMHGIARAGGGGNVTVPHKLTAAAALQNASSPVRRTGACNVFWLENGRLHGDNTDVAGVAAATRRLCGEIRGTRVLLVGAGGAAAASLCALLDGGVDRVTLVNRSPVRAETLQRRLDPAGSRCDVQSLDRVDGEAFDIVINATSLGLRSVDPLPLRLDHVRAGAVLDLVYHPDGTAWVRHAASLGIPATDGIEVLVAQGAAAFERWWHEPAPVDVMRAAVIG